MQRIEERNNILKEPSFNFTQNNLFAQMVHFKLLIISFILCPYFLFAGTFCKYSSEAKPTKAHAISTRQAQLQDAYDVLFHHLNLNIERTNKTISGSVRTTAKVLANSLDTFAFELHNDLTIDSVVCLGNRLPVRTILNERRVALPQTFLQGEVIDLRIYYHGTPPTNTGGAGIGDGFSNDFSPSWGNQITWSLSEPYSAFEWFPCKQSLRDKVDSVWVFVTTDSSNKVGSIGLLTNEVSLPNGKKRYEWKSKYPIDYYLISVAVGEYIEYKQYAHPLNHNDSILILNYIYNNPQTLPYFKKYIDSTAQMIEFFSDIFGLYPFADEKYGHVMAPFGGGMEHQTMTTLGNFNHGLVAHELAHQWFGDYVTCDSWSDIFLNEGFASYAEFLTKEFLLSKTKAWASMIDIHNDVMSQNGGSVWTADTSNNRVFDSRLTYNKGAAVIHSMRYVINNDSIFFLALRNYLNTHPYSTASIEDLKISISQTSGMDFSQFFDQWIYGEGYPIFNLKWNSNGSLLQLNNTQSTSSSTPIFVTPIDYLIKRNGLPDTVFRLVMNQNIQDYTLRLDGEVSDIFIDPQNWIMEHVNEIIKDTTLAFGTPSSIKDIENAPVKVYPNPASTMLTVEILAEDFKITILNTLGKKVMELNAKKREKINIEALPPSSYYGIVKTNEGANYFFKFLKQ